MTPIIDLSTPPGIETGEILASLRARCAAFLNADADTLALVSTVAEARILAARLDIVPADRTGEGAAALEAPSPAPALYRVGPPEAPLALFALDAPERAEPVRAASAPVAPILIEKAVAALAPAALASARQARDHADHVRGAGIAALNEALGLVGESDGDTVVFSPADPDAFSRRLDALALKLDRDGDRFTARLDAARLDALAAHLGAARPRAARIRRSTKETDIALLVDLDGQGASVSTGVHFFDHMLDQIARHAGIRLEVECEGDVEVDAHHTIEDVCLALGEALREALGDKRGIGRYGFALPMDETRASVWIDLSGRPYFRFDGEIPGERVGDYPVEMCAHAFRSISETLKASIHVEVDGDNAHHMIEACYKAFARALRQAVRIDGADLPSTKGVL
jgi:imidazoleglycerol-phosphate dehydratase / histidinol-phosphatase